MIVDCGQLIINNFFCQEKILYSLDEPLRNMLLRPLKCPLLAPAGRMADLNFNPFRQSHHITKSEHSFTADLYRFRIKPFSDPRTEKYLV